VGSDPCPTPFAHDRSLAATDDAMFYPGRASAFRERYVGCGIVQQLDCLLAGVIERDVFKGDGGSALGHRLSLLGYASSSAKNGLIAS
jgi:hypothetical protein